MKKGIVFFIVGFVLFGVCSVPNAAAQNVNYSQQIIGRWVDFEGKVWNFTANEVTITNSNYSSALKYTIIGTKLAIDDLRKDFIIYNITMSSDGRTLLLETSSRSSSFGSSVSSSILYKQ